MKLWTRNETAEGLHTAMVGPATVPELAAALDPAAPFVLLSDFTPIQESSWQEAVVPLTPSRALDPRRTTIRRMTIDVLLSTAEFAELAGDLGDFGIRAMQFRQRPLADVNYDDQRPRARVAKYRASGLTLSIELPHAGESALIAATTSEGLTEATRRLGLD